ncbi:hypothetical protein FBD94_15460 [Pedobacter hiemivivus]|uniref:Type II secretion system protein GspC N-terminal domain-containing protein n=1 Tax=Pedobacter hiemivivus TaxID=2530454 RepID=A0A4U1G8Y6_9SPHI|nr:hypothetical protein [Pedobacter hiemivivus]TKC60301.1 hypothetical protein FBD94_15460 [Pedobacter hiemivivus]
MQAAKNKKLTWFLICAVAVVWGVILYRLFFNNTEEDYVLKSPSVAAKHEPYDQYVLKEDTFKLVLNYKDPFLAGIAPVLAESKIAEPTLKPVNFAPALPPKPTVDWSIIKYSGYIINPVTKKMVAIVLVNGKERMLAEGEHFEGLQLLKNKKDSVLVSWKDKQKYIKQ